MGSSQDLEKGSNDEMVGNGRIGCNGEGGTAQRFFDLARQRQQTKVSFATTRLQRNGILFKYLYNKLILGG